SRRYCSRTCSRMAKLLAAEKSIPNLPGPRRMLRPDVPKVLGALTLNASVANHFLIFSPREPDVRNGAETTSAKSFPVKLAELSTPEVTESGKPDCQFQIPLVCQPPIMCRNAPEAGDGRCQT